MHEERIQSTATDKISTITFQNITHIGEHIGEHVGEHIGGACRRACRGLIWEHAGE